MLYVLRQRVADRRPPPLAPLRPELRRGTPQAFEHDEKAAALSLDVISKGWDTADAGNYTFVQRLFVYLPLMHSEKIEAQVSRTRACAVLARVLCMHRAPLCGCSLASSESTSSLDDSTSCRQLIGR